VKISAKEHKNSMRSELPKIAMLPKKGQFGRLGVNFKVNFRSQTSRSSPLQIFEVLVLLIANSL
jgi:hypothetical protein